MNEFMTQYEDLQERVRSIESGATPKSADFIQAYLSAYYDRPLIVDHILAGVNVSNGYPYWVAGYREATP